MKFKIALISVLGIACVNSLAMDATKVDVKDVCDVKKQGINKVLETAIVYNKEAKAQDLEFMRLGMKTSQYISGVQEALKSDSKSVDIVDKKKKKTGSVSIEYAAWRACSFAIRPLQQAKEAETTWRLAVPGDGYKY